MKKNIFSRKLLKIIWLITFISILSWTVYAQKDSWWKYGSDPISILNEVASDANSDRAYAVQDTQLDGVKAWPWRYRIYNTLQWIRRNISPYIQRAVYVWLTTAVILIIFNWLRMVTTGIHDAWKFEDIKKNIINICIWILLLTGFYVIFKLIIAAINAIFGQ